MTDSEAEIMRVLLDLSDRAFTRDKVTPAGRRYRTSSAPSLANNVEQINRLLDKYGEPQLTETDETTGFQGGDQGP